jgi:hypothetical protein
MKTKKQDCVYTCRYRRDIPRCTAWKIRHYELYEKNNKIAITMRGKEIRRKKENESLGSSPVWKLRNEQQQQQNTFFFPGK